MSLDTTVLCPLTPQICVPWHHSSLSTGTTVSRSPPVSVQTIPCQTVPATINVIQLILLSPTLFPNTRYFVWFSYSHWPLIQAFPTLPSSMDLVFLTVFFSTFCQLRLCHLVCKLSPKPSTFPDNSKPKNDSRLLHPQHITLSSLSPTGPFV